MNETKLKEYLRSYKEKFKERWEDEKYKWEAVKCFQDNWDINDSNFEDMFGRATEMTANLLASAHYYPRSSIMKISQKKGDDVLSKMFKNLFNESRNVFDRISQFKENVKKLGKELGEDKVDQDNGAVSTYLLLRYPHKYYVYRSKVFEDVANLLEFPLKKEDKDNVKTGYQMYDEIRKYILQDNDLISLLKSLLTDKCYPDNDYRILTGDFAYFLSSNDKKFEAWAKSRSYAKSSIEQYIKMLHSHICKTLKIDNYSNLFYLFDSKEFEQIKKKIVSNDKYDEFNKKLKGTPNAALEAYAKFLVEEYGADSMEISIESNNKISQIFNGKNTILYGTPGTGKTYNAKKRALEILEGVKISDEIYEKNYEEYDAKYDDYVDKGQIAFITFHQSYSYEDFIEGLRPVIDDEDFIDNENGGVRYEIRSGVFKEICEKARLKSNFDESYSAFIECLSGLPDKNGKKKLHTPNKSNFFVSVNSRKNLTLYTGKGDKKNGTLTYDKIRKCAEGAPQVYWNGYYLAVVEELKKNYNLSTKISEPYVLIIDEINRGNISKIFGELITLIEDDKREKLKVILPYSQEEFTVPKNLYIIGTMNTADRSIAALDIALRRRFAFREMMPKSNLVPKKVENIMLREKFEEMNKRITALLGRDHQIGHSYFMNIKTMDDLKNIWFNKIVPLINEYFYGDWEKMKLVIPGFIKEEDVPKELSDYCDTEKIYSFVEADTNDFKMLFKNMYKV